MRFFLVCGKYICKLKKIEVHWKKIGSLAEEKPATEIDC